MPTLPLYVTPADPDASHRVTSPGGYERWHFDAHDPVTDTQIFIDFFDGVPFHPAYLRRYAAYRRWPTRVAPPTPADYPGISVAIFRQGGVLSLSNDIYAASSFTSPDVSLAGNRAIRRPDGAYEIHVQTDACVLDLVFTPVLAGLPEFDRWTIAAPLCSVIGSIRAGGDTFEFNGVGYHDHDFATHPISRRRIRGRVLSDDWTAAFEIDVATGTSLKSRLVLINATAAQTQTDTCSLRGRRNSSSGLICPEEIAFGKELSLAEPRILGASWSTLYATFNATLAGRPAIALCQALDFHRARWPLIGRMLERSFNVMPSGS